jgi:hypothetical protein
MKIDPDDIIALHGVGLISREEAREMLAPYLNPEKKPSSIEEIYFKKYANPHVIQEGSLTDQFKEPPVDTSPLPPERLGSSGAPRVGSDDARPLHGEGSPKNAVLRIPLRTDQSAPTPGGPTGPVRQPFVDVSVPIRLMMGARGDYSVTNEVLDIIRQQLNMVGIMNVPPDALTQMGRQLVEALLIYNKDPFEGKRSGIVDPKGNLVWTPEPKP